MVPASPDRAAITRALLEYGHSLGDYSAGGFTPNEEADRFVRSDPFAFLVAVICDEQVRFERAWGVPLELRRRLGHWDVHRMAAAPKTLIDAFAQPPALHRWVTKTADRVARAAHVVASLHGGDTSRLWSDLPPASQLYQRFEAFDGIGQKKAAMAVELVDRELGIPLGGMSGSDIAVDIHVRRVFLRTGLAERDDAVHMITVARELHPERPGALDYPAWEIGRRWCRPSVPACAACPIDDVCPKLLDRAMSARGA